MSALHIAVCLRERYGAPSTGAIGHRAESRMRKGTRPLGGRPSSVSTNHRAQTCRIANEKTNRILEWSTFVWLDNGRSEFRALRARSESMRGSGATTSKSVLQCQSERRVPLHRGSPVLDQRVAVGGFPSSRRSALPPGKSRWISRVPSGQRISSESIFDAAPSPNVRVFSGAER